MISFKNFSKRLKFYKKASKVLDKIFDENTLEFGIELQNNVIEIFIIKDDYIKNKKIECYYSIED